MRIWLIFGICLAIHFLAVHSSRGTFSRNTDEEFQMLIAGGLFPDKGKYVRNLVSIRTLQYVEYPGDNHFCTGVIISSRTVMTAAHCVTDRHKSVVSARGLLIVFGSVYRLDQYGTDDCRRVDRVVVHPKYRRFGEHDVALLRMASRIPGNMRHVKPIIRLKKITIHPGMVCITLGWGQLYLHGPYANELMYLEVTIRPTDFCANIPKYEDFNICAEPNHEGQLCPGDLGGPLMCQDHLAGIIGGTYGCSSKVAMKFVNFTHIEKWVQKAVLAWSGTNGYLQLSVTLRCLSVAFSFNKLNIHYCSFF